MHRALIWKELFDSVINLGKVKDLFTGGSKVRRGIQEVFNNIGKIVAKVGRYSRVLAFNNLLV